MYNLCMLKKVLKILIVALPLFLTSCASQIKNLTFNSETNSYSCIYKGTEHNFILCLPEKSVKNPSLIIMLHGYGENGLFFKHRTQFDKAACARGYAVAYLTGKPRPNIVASSTGWNYSDDRYSKSDLNFLIDLSHYLQKEFSLDKKNLFAVGYSNGAFMCHKLATRKYNSFTAIASVAGMMPKNVWDKRKKSSPLSFIQINGTKDDVVPMKDCKSSLYNPNPLMEDVIEYYAKSNKVEDKLNEEVVSDKAKALKYGDKVWWIITEGGAHNWPSPSYCGYKVNPLILDFFDLNRG